MILEVALRSENLLHELSTKMVGGLSPSQDGDEVMTGV